MLLFEPTSNARLIVFLILFVMILFVLAYGLNEIYNNSKANKDKSRTQ